MSKGKTYQLFRNVALAEGISYLLLLGIAMPLKYMFDQPMAVSIVGGIHGALFIAFMICMYLVHDRHNKGLLWMLKAFVASIIPFGTFVMDREWKKEQLQVMS